MEEAISALAASSSDNQQISSSVVTPNELVNIALERGGNTSIDIRDADSSDSNEIQNITSNDGTVNIARTVNDFDLSVDGTETIVSGAGINLVTGDGSAATPYVITVAE